MCKLLEIGVFVFIRVCCNEMVLYIIVYVGDVFMIKFFFECGVEVDVKD